MKLPKFILNLVPRRIALRSEPANVAGSATAQTVTSAIRSAEGGDTGQLFSLYRDIIVGDSHIQTEFSKRKLALLGDTMNILPRDKNKPEDVKAAKAVRQALEDCDGWIDALTFALDSCLYPVSVLEKIMRAADPGSGLRFTLKKLEPVNYAVLCFRQSYGRSLTPGSKQQAPAAEVEVWEPDLRFYKVDEHGAIQKSEATAEPADETRHLVHRGHLLVGIRDNWGGPMRSITYWWLLGVLGREWFSRFMERFGNPFILGKTDSTNKEAVTFLQEALSLSTKIGGLVVDHETEIELKEAMLSGGADAYEKFLAICNREKSKAIVGQELSTTAASTGMGSGVANLQGQVRDDIRMFDQLKLAETLEKQLFKQILLINGLHGAVPRVRWGGLSSEEAQETGGLLVSLSNAGLEPTDEAIPGISERVGFEVQRKAAAPPAFGGMPFSAITRFDSGDWITVNGTPILIEDGESIDSAISKKFGNPKASRRKVSIDQAAEALKKKGIKLGQSETKPDADGKWRTRYKITRSDGREDSVSIETIRHLTGLSALLPDDLVIVGLAAPFAPESNDPTDKLIASRAKVLGEAYRGAMAPFRQIILSSTSREDCLKKLAAFYPDWKPDRLNAEFEVAMQLCAAAGAAAAKP